MKIKQGLFMMTVVSDNDNDDDSNGNDDNEDEYSRKWKARSSVGKNIKIKRTVTSQNTHEHTREAHKHTIW